MTSDGWNSPQSFLKDFLLGYNHQIGSYKVFHLFLRLTSINFFHWQPLHVLVKFWEVQTYNWWLKSKHVGEIRVLEWVKVFSHEWATCVPIWAQMIKSIFYIQFSYLHSWASVISHITSFQCWLCESMNVKMSRITLDLWLFPLLNISYNLTPKTMRLISLSSTYISLQ